MRSGSRVHQGSGEISEGGGRSQANGANAKPKAKAISNFRSETVPSTCSAAIEFFPVGATACLARPCKACEKCGRFAPPSRDPAFSAGSGASANCLADDGTGIWHYQRLSREN
jgi:hypothetical protein